MYDEAGNLIFSDDGIARSMMWLGSGAPIPAVGRIVIRTIFTPLTTETRYFGFANSRHIHLKLNGVSHINEKAIPTTEDPFMSLMDPPLVTKKYDFVAGKPVEIDIDVDMSGRVGIDSFAFGINFGFQVDKSNPEAKLEAAINAAKDADVAIVVVGTNAQVESEGYDRKSLALPGDQNRLVEEVARVNKRTIVVVNSGSPVILPWKDHVSGILVTYFAGQEMGNALVDMLSGRTEPGGRLPTTWAGSEQSVPVSDVTPQHGKVNYVEGLHIGYRAWQKANQTPAFWFGSGFGYTTWNIDSPSQSIELSDEKSFTLKVILKNTGNRKGKQVIQIYAEAINSQVERPTNWLVGFADTKLNSGESKEVLINISSKEFRYWQNGWQKGSGEYLLKIATNAAEVHAVARLKIN